MHNPLFSQGNLGTFFSMKNFSYSLYLCPPRWLAELALNKYLLNWAQFYTRKQSPKWPFLILVFNLEKLNSFLFQHRVEQFIQLRVCWELEVRISGSRDTWKLLLLYLWLLIKIQEVYRFGWDIDGFEEIVYSILKTISNAKTWHFVFYIISVVLWTHHSLGERKPAFFL